MLLLVQSQNNYHRAPISDPVFPADQLVDPPLLPNVTLFYNSDRRATGLACVDQVSFCAADGSTCWSDYNNPTKELKAHNEQTGYYMLGLALLRSNICNSILLRGDSALNAQSKIQANISLPLSLPGSLSNEQWKIEARKLFEASLARIQIDLRDYIRGAAANEIGFSTRTWNAGFKDMCGAYKFQTVGWKNVSVGGFWLCAALVTVVYALSIEVKQPDDSTKLFAEVIWDTRLGWYPFRELAARWKRPTVGGNSANGRIGEEQGASEPATKNSNKASR
jgi:hypothetical protein